MPDYVGFQESASRELPFEERGSESLLQNDPGWLKPYRCDNIRNRFRLRKQEAEARLINYDDSYDLVRTGTVQEGDLGVSIITQGSPACEELNYTREQLNSTSAQLNFPGTTVCVTRTTGT